MRREDKFLEYCQEYANKGYVAANIPKILENLEKAWQDNQLEAFLLSKKPYISAFPFVIDIHHGARRKDQVAIVLAMNIFGADHPEFVFRLSEVMKKMVSIALFLYSWVRLFFWIGLPRYHEAVVAPKLREVGNCLEVTQ